ncbi:MAG: hypothetical protein AAGE52_33280 [Myxococcota bacterium]
MKFANAKKLWVVERRGTVVFTRGGSVRRPGVPKAKEHKTEDAAEAYLKAQVEKRMADGFVLLDREAGLDAPFTLDGERAKASVPARYQKLVETVRAEVRAGVDLEAVDALIDALTDKTLRAQRARKAERKRAKMTMEERLADAAMEAHLHAKYPDEEDAGSTLRDLLYEAARSEFAALKK